MYVYKEVISKVVFYYEISTFDAFRVPVRLTFPISIIIYCVSEDFLIMKDLKASEIKSLSDERGLF